MVTRKSLRGAFLIELALLAWAKLAFHLAFQPRMAAEARKSLSVLPDCKRLLPQQNDVKGKSLQFTGEN